MFFSQKIEPDPRGAIILSVLASLALWKTHFLGLFVLFSLLAIFYCLFEQKNPQERKLIKRLVLFACIWPLVKIIVSILPILWQYFDASTHTKDAQELSLASFYLHIISQMYEPFLEALAIFIRLILLMGIGFLLTGIFSPRELGLGFVWFFKPFSKKHAWKLALAISIMLQYLRRIPKLFLQLRATTKLRGLPPKGFAYWKIILPRLLSLLGKETIDQAVALASRNLDNPEAWELSKPIRVTQALVVIFLSAGLLALQWL